VREEPGVDEAKTKRWFLLIHFEKRGRGGGLIASVRRAFIHIDIIKLLLPKFCQSVQRQFETYSQRTKQGFNLHVMMRITVYVPDLWLQHGNHSVPYMGSLIGDFAVNSRSLIITCSS
jgi:hypothetical protein